MAHLDCNRSYLGRSYTLHHPVDVEAGATGKHWGNLATGMRLEDLANMGSGGEVLEDHHPVGFGHGLG